MAENTPPEVAEIMEIAEGTNAGVKLNVPAQLTNMMMANLIRNQAAQMDEAQANTQAMNQVRLVTMQRFVKTIDETGIDESVAFQKVAAGSDSTQALSSVLTAAISQILQQKVPVAAA